jgi:hypothetical protein
MTRFRDRVIATSFRSTNKRAQNTVDQSHTFENFQSNPVTAAVGGGAASGTAQAANALMTEKNAFEYAALGTQTITAPRKVAGGLNINQDQTDNDGLEFGQGIIAGSKHAYTVGDGGFFVRAKLSIATVAGTDDCAVGFRKVEAYNAAIDAYTDMAVLNVIAGAINIETILNNAATTTTDTTQDIVDGATVELTVKVDKNGVVTYLIDGVAPTVTAAFTFDDGDVVVPFLFFLNAAGVAGQVVLQEWEVGAL